MPELNLKQRRLMSSNRRSYSELKLLKTFEERYNYLRCGGQVGLDTFGYDRWINQQFYRSKEWKRARRDVIIRDDGCDLGIPGHEIFDRIYIHHINPITVDDLVDEDPSIFDPNNLICVSFTTHQAIHYGDESLLPKPIIERLPGDTKLW